jgi:hypothetical protein
MTQHYNEFYQDLAFDKTEILCYCDPRKVTQVTLTTRG